MCTVVIYGIWHAAETLLQHQQTTFLSFTSTDVIRKSRLSLLLPKFRWTRWPHLIHQRNKSVPSFFKEVNPTSPHSPSPPRLPDFGLLYMFKSTSVKGTVKASLSSPTGKQMESRSSVSRKRNIKTHINNKPATSLSQTGGQELCHPAFKKLRRSVKVIRTE